MILQGWFTTYNAEYVFMQRWCAPQWKWVWHPCIKACFTRSFQLTDLILPSSKYLPDYYTENICFHPGDNLPWYLHFMFFTDLLQTARFNTQLSKMNQTFVMSQRVKRFKQSPCLPAVQRQTKQEAKMEPFLQAAVNRGLILFSLLRAAGKQ